MTLRITLTVGREVVDEVSITRITNIETRPTPDDTSTYLVSRKGDEHPVTVEHRYGDGAPRLAEVALHRLRTRLTPDPDTEFLDRGGRCTICRHRHEMGNPWTEHPCRWCKRCDESDAGRPPATIADALERRDIDGVVTALADGYRIPEDEEATT